MQHRSKWFFLSLLEWAKVASHVQSQHQPIALYIENLLPFCRSVSGSMVIPCVICGAELKEIDEIATCTFCGQSTLAHFRCPDGHHICDDCQLADWPQVVERVCEGTRERDPVAIVNLIMKHPMSVMHSPQHHILVPPAILAALRNRGLRPLKPGRLASAIERTKGIPLAACGSRGECGAAVGVGTAVSILTHASHLKDRERSLALRATAEALLAIAAAGGPRCCKQSVYLSLEVASGFLKQELDLNLPVQARCEFAGRNGECKKERCRYYVA